MPTIKNINIQDGDILSIVKNIKFTTNTSTNYAISPTKSGIYTAIETFKEEFNEIPSSDFMPFNDIPGGPSFPSSLNLRELTLSGLRISKDTTDDEGTYFFYDPFDSSSYVAEIQFEAIAPSLNNGSPYQHVAEYSGYHCGLVDFKNKLELSIQLNINNTISIVGPAIDYTGFRTAATQVAFVWDSIPVTFKIWANFSLNEITVIAVNSGVETILLKDDIFNYTTDIQQIFFGSKSFATDNIGHTIFIGNDSRNNSVSIELHDIVGYGDIIRHPAPIYKNTAFLKYSNYLDLIAWPKSKAFYSNLIDNETYPTESGTTSLDLDTTRCFIYWSCGFSNIINPTGVNTGLGVELVINNTLLYARVLYDVNTSTTYLGVYNDSTGLSQTNNLSKYETKLLASDSFTFSALLDPTIAFSSLITEQDKDDYFGNLPTSFTSDSRITFGSFNSKGITTTNFLFIFRDVEVYHLSKENTLISPSFESTSNMTDIKEGIPLTSITTNNLGYLSFSSEEFQVARTVTLTNYDRNNTGVGIYLKLQYLDSLDSHIELPFLIINRGIAGRGLTLCAVRHSVHTIGDSVTPTTYNWFIYFKESPLTLSEVIYQNTESALELSFLIENKNNLTNCELFIDIDPVDGLALYYENKKVISLASTNLPISLYDSWLNSYSFSVAFGKLWNHTFTNSTYNQIIFSKVVISSSQGYEVLTELSPNTETEKEVISKSGNILLDIRDIS